MTEPTVIPTSVICTKCGTEWDLKFRDGGRPMRPFSAAEVRELTRDGRHTWHEGFGNRLLVPNGTPITCGGKCLLCVEPVPGMGTPYPATERDEDSEYEYAREDAPLLQEDRL